MGNIEERKIIIDEESFSNLTRGSLRKFLKRSQILNNFPQLNVPLRAAFFFSYMRCLDSEGATRNLTIIYVPRFTAHAKPVVILQQTAGPMTIKRGETLRGTHLRKHDLGI